ncbi:Hypothetical predicted protein [Olea europaea subsp. europaea]|uniref:Transmembrane protein n=1 Tax=Olea europaea subsp. europaea TaxID=158383 RepID=A0A8S0TG11_OLEEU|nr:Hypothetical predicted protein [Olea europaea subsp. europaea]
MAVGSVGDGVVVMVLSSHPSPSPLSIASSLLSVAFRRHFTDEKTVAITLCVFSVGDYWLMMAEAMVVVVLDLWFTLIWLLLWFTIDYFSFVAVVVVVYGAMVGMVVVNGGETLVLVVEVVVVVVATSIFWR